MNKFAILKQEVHSKFTCQINNTFFVLSGALGFAYNFEFCTGQENNSEIRRKPSEPDVGAGANVVVCLA